MPQKKHNTIPATDQETSPENKAARNPKNTRHNPKITNGIRHCHSVPPVDEFLEFKRESTRERYKALVQDMYAILF